jgi:uncharacterized radical SAM superfamily Fe-S cluster-containing enzyme
MACPKQNAASLGPKCRERSLADHLYYASTRSLCGACKQPVDGTIVFRNDTVVLEKFCPDHGHQECLVSSSVDWYLDALSFLAPNDPPQQHHTPVGEGCPLDCGFCPAHQQALYLPVIPITSACNLDCPICYTINKNRDAYRMPEQDFKRILEQLKSTHNELDIINFTGGEPMLHPEILRFLKMCQEVGLRRLTISTNGLTLLDQALVQQLAEIDARIILSLDTFNDETDRLLHGVPTREKKQQALDLLTRHNVSTTILPAIAKGVNDHEVPRLLELVLERPNVVSLEIHTMCFTGQGGLGFPRSGRITIADLHGIIDAGTEGRITTKDFVPSPLAHPHCYSICYLLLLDKGQGYLPFTRLLGRDTLYSLLKDSLYIEPRDQMEQVFADCIDDLWANPNRLEQSEAVLETLKRLINDLFPSDGPVLSITQRRRIAEQSVKAIYIHSHMDEENFDVSRLMKCCVGVPYPDGSTVPTCAYNVLYRECDSRFADASMLDRMADVRHRHISTASRDGGAR